MALIDFILKLLGLIPKDPNKTAERFNRTSSTAGDRLRPWLYALIGGAVVLLLVAIVAVALMS